MDDVAKDKMEQEMDQAAKALFLAVCWMQDLKAIYKPTREQRPREKRYFGARGL